MATCAACGSDVTGKKFCQQCGTPIQTTGGQSVSLQNTCPRCNGEVKAGAAFCMHCGSSLSAQTSVATSTPSQPMTRLCPNCHSEVPLDNTFCSNCGQSTHATPTPPVVAAPSFCTNCGRQNAPGVKFCGGCGSPLTANTGASMPQTGYGYTTSSYPQEPQQPYAPQQYGAPAQPYPQPQYPQPQYPQQQYPQQQYPQQPYGQVGYQPQPMVGQQPMALRCPVCMAMAPMGTPNCPSCRTSLAGVVPTPAMAASAPGQQGGLGGFFQGDKGKMAMGALGGAAAVIGGEMLLHGMENRNEDRDDGYGYEHHRRHGEEGMLGGLGNLANDIGLF